MEFLIWQLTIIKDCYSFLKFEVQQGDSRNYHNIFTINIFTVKYEHINLDLRIKEKLKRSAVFYVRDTKEHFIPQNLAIDNYYLHNLSGYLYSA